MTDTTRISTSMVVFTDMVPEDRRVAAVLITRDGTTGEFKAYVKDVPGCEPPDMEAVAWLLESTRQRNT